MPKRTPKSCGRHGCRSYAEQGYYCNEHQPKREDDREPAHMRGYDSNWSKFARMYKRQHPLCARCGHATEVPHHIVALDDGGDKYDESNLEPLCRNCHERHHGRVR